MEENPKAIEGTIPKGRLVILKFPSKEHAKGFFNDQEYQPLKLVMHRLKWDELTLVFRCQL